MPGHSFQALLAVALTLGSLAGCKAAPTLSGIAINGGSTSCNPETMKKNCHVAVNVDALGAGGPAKVYAAAFPVGTVAPTDLNGFDTTWGQQVSTTGAVMDLYTSPVDQKSPCDVYVIGASNDGTSVTEVTKIADTTACKCPPPPTLTKVRAVSLTFPACEDNDYTSSDISFHVELTNEKKAKVYAIVQLESKAAPTSYSDFKAYKNVDTDPIVEMEIEKSGNFRLSRGVTIASGKADADYKIYVTAKTQGGWIAPIVALNVHTQCAPQCKEGVIFESHVVPNQRGEGTTIVDFTSNNSMSCMCHFEPCGHSLHEKPACGWSDGKCKDYVERKYTTSCSAEKGCTFDCEITSCKDSCHPADALVRVEHPSGDVSSRRMDTLRIGDRVESDHGIFEPLIAFSHRDAGSVGEYFQFVAGNHTLEIADGHYLYANGNKLIQPRDVRVGDVLSTGNTVSSLGKVKKLGVFHLHTYSGTLVVNGVKTSCNTETFGFGVDVQDYATTPIMYALYKMGIPFTLAPNNKLFWRGKEFVEMVSGVINHVARVVRSVVPTALLLLVGPVIGPLIAVPFVCGALAYVYPQEAVALGVAVLYWAHRARGNKK